jgi:hypothetical protein
MKTSLSACRIGFAAFYLDGRDHAACGLERQGYEPQAAIAR